MIDYEKIYKTKLEPNIMDSEGRHSYPPSMSKKEVSMLFFIYQLLKIENIPKVIVETDISWLEHYLHIYLLNPENEKFTVGDLLNYLKNHI